MRLRQALGVYANLRPAICFSAIEDCSPLRPEVVRGTDVMIVRELLGGLYFGQPRSTQGAPGKRSAIDTMTYGEPEIERIAHMAFGLARSRRRKVTSVDKANVLDCSRLWRDVVTRVGQQYADVKLSHMYVDSAAMALVARPADFDVILTENMFGDILSDQAGAVVGSIGMLGSASIGGTVGLYEPVHGSAPDITGQGIANPLGAILSAAMLLRYSFKLETEAACIESAVAPCWRRAAARKTWRRNGQAVTTTVEMGKKVAEAVREDRRQRRRRPRQSPRRFVRSVRGGNGCALFRMHWLASIADAHSLAFHSLAAYTFNLSLITSHPSGVILNGLQAVKDLARIGRTGRDGRWRPCRCAQDPSPAEAGLRMTHCFSGNGKNG